ncbi:hypothetical protein GJR88_04711 [Dietzia sp. DQ12-45-1b]|nr:hypothetical protein GJR88_04711 [Dietzia sp. DQ12-45-1b]
MGHGSVTTGNTLSHWCDHLSRRPYGGRNPSVPSREFPS